MEQKSRLGGLVWNNVMCSRFLCRAIILTLLVVVALTREQNREQCSSEQDTCDERERNCNRHMNVQDEIKKELDGNEEQHEADSLVHVFQIRHELHNQSVQRSKTHDSTHASSPNHISIISDTEDGWNRIESKHNIAEFDGDEHEQQRCGLPFMEERRTVELTTDWNNILCQLQGSIFRDVFFVILISEEHNVCSPKQESSSNEKDRPICLDRDCANTNHESTKHDSTDDTPEENPVLCLL